MKQRKLKPNQMLLSLDDFPTFEVLAQTEPEMVLPNAFQELHDAGGHGWNSVSDPAKAIADICGE
jgi:hypothetical protein